MICLKHFPALAEIINLVQNATLIYRPACGATLLQVIARSMRAAITRSLHRGLSLTGEQSEKKQHQCAITRTDRV